MKFPNWFRIAWWLAVLAALGLCIYARSPTISSGIPTTFDVALVIITAAVALVPIYAEVSIGSLTLKQQIEAVKTEVRDAVSTLSARMEQKTDIHQHFYPVPADAEIPGLQRLTNAAVEVAAVDQQPEAAEPEEVEPVASRVAPGSDKAPMGDAFFLATTRVKLEAAVRDLAYRRGFTLGSKEPFHKVLSRLLSENAIPSELITPIRAIYSICSAAIHGEDVTESQAEFVRDSQKVIIRTVRNLS